MNRKKRSGLTAWVMIDVWKTDHFAEPFADLAETDLLTNKVRDMVDDLT
jgi:hypothetical protein